MKTWLCFMCGPGSLDNIKSLVDPVIDYFDGVVAVLHDARGSEEEKYLESVKKTGKVIHYYYCRRHDASRNQYLYCGPIQNGDWCCQIDDKERLNPQFAARIPELITQLQSQGLNAVWYYGKPFLFEYHESLQYMGNPHEGLRRLDGLMRNAELSNAFPNEQDVRYSVRGEQRPDPYHFIRHYLRYFMFPWGSNQTLLGAEHRGDPSTVYYERERWRAEFREELMRRGVKWHEDALIEYWKTVPLDDVMRRMINREKILQDAYRYLILNDLTVRDEHDWVSMKTVT